MSSIGKVSHSPQTAAVPLSPNQTMIWLAHQFDPADPSSHRPVAFRLRGELNFEALKNCLDEILRRHDVLRSVFPVIDGEPMQIALPPQRAHIEVRDLQTLPMGEREDRAHRIAVEEACGEFDLVKGPVFRPVLLRLSPIEHVLLIAMHHIVFDGWSENVLFDEVTELYDAFHSGREPALPTLPLQYAEFALRQRERLSKGVLETQLVYWKKQLGGLTPLSLATDYPRENKRSSKATKESVHLSSSLVERLKRLSREQRATFFMTLLTAFHVLLSRYTNQVDIAVGVPTAGRTDLDTEKSIGCFINMLVMRADLSDNPTFLSALNQTRNVALEAYDNGEVPVEKIIEALQPARTRNRWPLFQALFDLRSMPRAKARRAGDLELTPLQLETGFIGAVDLVLALTETSDGLRCDFSYPVELFRAETIARMSRHYQVLLESVVVQPSRRIAALPILTDSEKRQLLMEWNNTEADYLKDRCVHELFEKQAEQTPDAVAVEFEERLLTYRELNAKANRLASYLRRLGAGPEIPVAICMEPSAETVVGLLGILKAGAVCLPMDPVYPTERLTYMLAESRATVLLTEERFLERLAHLTVRLVATDACRKEIGGESDRNPKSGIGPKNLAFIIYTSGSTGRPKGVMVEHGSLVNYLCWVNDKLFGDDVHWLPLTATISFDMSLKQIFAPLLSGGRVWVLGKELISDPVELLKAFRSRNSAALNCTPSLWQTVLRHIEAAKAGDDRIPAYLFVGGEQLSPELVRRSLTALPQLQLWNLYGPTEATANASAARITSVDQVTIGRPIANTQLYVLDDTLEPVPVGVPGELYIAGKGVARGYMAKPEATAARFIPNPFATEPGARLYKTGDLVRYGFDGNLEFRGRVDNLVKIRGFRIELGEIEATLRSHENVREAVATVVAGADGDKRLVAYLAPAHNARLTVPEVTRFLKTKLPEFMCPASIVFMETLPVTRSGKTDRHALPAPSTDRPELNSAFVAPRTANERVIGEIWMELLEVKQIGRNDNFFELGGHSLLATRAVFRAAEFFRVAIPVRCLFENPTLAAFAAQIDRHVAGGDPSKKMAELLSGLESLSEEEAVRQLGNRESFGKP